VLSRGGAESAFESYTRARALFENGRVVEAMTEVRALESRGDDLRIRDLLGQLKNEIELAPKLKTISQLIDAKSYSVAEQQLDDVLRQHPHNAQALLLRTTLHAALAVPPRLALSPDARARPARPPVPTTAPLPASAEDSAKVAKVVKLARPSHPRYARVRPAVVTKVAAVPVKEVENSPAKAEQPKEPPAGKLRVEATEPCSIFVDGVDAGRSTPAVLPMPPGIHVVAVRSQRDGIARKEQSVTIRAGVSSTVAFTLRAKSVRPIDSNNPYGGI
jgi:hypothetical protein